MTTQKQDSDFIGSVIDQYLLENSIEWIKSNMLPEDVFDEDLLDDWAQENDYVKE